MDKERFDNWEAGLPDKIIEKLTKKLKKELKKTLVDAVDDVDHKIRYSLYVFCEKLFFEHLFVFMEDIKAKFVLREDFYKPGKISINLDIPDDAESVFKSKRSFDDIITEAIEWYSIDDDNEDAISERDTRYRIASMLRKQADRIEPK